MAKTASLSLPKPLDLLNTLGVALACRPWRKEANLAGRVQVVGRTTFAVEIDETSLINTILQLLPRHAIFKQVIIQGDLPRQDNLQFKIVEVIL